MKKIVEAVPAFNKLYRADLPLQTAYQLFRLGARLQTELEYFNQKKSEILAKYPIGDKAVEVENKKNIELAEKEYGELCNIEVELDDARPEIDCGCGVALSASDIGYLDGIVLFRQTSSADSLKKE